MLPPPKFRARWTIARGPSHTPFGGVRNLAITYRRCMWGQQGPTRQLIATFSLNLTTGRRSTAILRLTGLPLCRHHWVCASQAIAQQGQKSGTSRGKNSVPRHGCIALNLIFTISPPSKAYAAVAALVRARCMAQSQSQESQDSTEMDMEPAPPGGYSRRANTVHTRIDRIYSQLYNSPWHCNTVKEDPTLFSEDATLAQAWHPHFHSDHLALPACRAARQDICSRVGLSP
eukprot:scaffold7660_cov154-Isochrysis_galbana.AAC.1